MHTPSIPEASYDGTVSVIAVLILLLGTASGSAIAMLAAAAISLLLTAVFQRRRLGRTAWLVVIAGAVVAAIIAITLTQLN